ncbi:MAG: universal stress protein [Candidatus Thermoplasmatota archaeon]|nr:universal stress protein [Candidatus Thermoplasmatota archaeon]
MKSILVAYDGSENSKLALEKAIKISKHNETAVVVINVIPPELSESSLSKMLLPGIKVQDVIRPGGFKASATGMVEEAVKKAKGDGVNKVKGIVKEGDAADEIINAAEKLDCEMVILGCRGYAKQGRFLLGSVADKVVRYSTKSVLVAR